MKYYSNKIRIYLILFLSIGVVPDSNAIVLNEGEVALVSFDTLAVVGPTHYPSNLAFSSATFYFNDFDFGEQLVASYHENSLSDPAVDVDILSNGANFWSVNLHGAFVDDLQGIISLESLSGSMDITHVDISAVAYGTEYFGTFGVTLIPSPTSGLLFLIGLFGLVGVAKRTA